MSADLRTRAREHFMEATALLGEKAYEELLDMVEDFMEKEAARSRAEEQVVNKAGGKS